MLAQILVESAAHALYWISGFRLHEAIGDPGGMHSGTRRCSRLVEYTNSCNFASSAAGSYSFTLQVMALTFGIKMNPVLRCIGLLGLISSGLVAGCKTDCAGETPNECGQLGECEIVKASELVSGCAKEAIGVACRDKDVNCDGALTIARDQRGTEWRFADTCVPSGWTPVQHDGASPDCE